MHDIRFYDEVFFVFCCRHSFVLSFFLCNIFFFVLVSLFLVRDFFPSRNEFPSTKYLDQFTLEPTEHFFVIRFSFLVRFCHLSPTHVFFFYCSSHGYGKKWRTLVISIKAWIKGNA